MATKAQPRGPRKGAQDPNALRVNGDAIWNARRKIQQTQIEVAFHAQVSIRLVSQLENNIGPDIMLSTLGRIAKALDVAPEKLLTDEPRPKVRKPRL